MTIFPCQQLFIINFLFLANFVSLMIFWWNEDGEEINFASWLNEAQKQRELRCLLRSFALTTVKNLSKTFLHRHLSLPSSKDEASVLRDIKKLSVFPLQSSPKIKGYVTLHFLRLLRSFSLFNLIFLRKTEDRTVKRWL